MSDATGALTSARAAAGARVVALGGGHGLAASLTALRRITEQLTAVGVRTHVDDRDQVSPGFKFNEWELRGVPIRLEIGPRDLASGVATLARRLGTGKEQISLDAAHVTVPIALDEFQDFLLQRATEFRDTHTVVVDDWDSFVAAVQTGWAKAFHCGSGECEDTIKAETAATPRCIPFDAPEETGVCVRCGQPSAYGKRVIFSRAY